MKTKTIAQQLNVTEFPFEINDSNDNLIYCEYSSGYWAKFEYDSNDNEIYREDSDGDIVDDRPKLDELIALTTTVSDLHFKVAVNPVTSKMIQLKLFELGVIWASRPESMVKYTDSNYLYINHGKLQYGNSYSNFSKASEELLHTQEVMELLDRVVDNPIDTSITLVNGTKIELSLDSYNKLLHITKTKLDH